MGGKYLHFKINNCLLIFYYLCIMRTARMFFFKIIENVHTFDVTNLPTSNVYLMYDVRT